MNNKWNQIVISEKQVATNIISILKDKITSVYVSNNKPKDFACFFKAKNAQSSHIIYLSPKASIECEIIINEYNPEECDQPDYSSMGLFAGNNNFPL